MGREGRECARCEVQGASDVGKFVFGVFLLVLFLQLSAAADFNHIITNSENWRDVYSGIHYANLNGVESDFLTSVGHGRILLGGISNTRDVRVVTSRDEQFVFNYPDLIVTEGFSSADEIVARNLNIELLNEMPDIENFIIIDDSYGYPAIAVAPYAVQKEAWVFFANRINIEDIDAILSRRNIGELMIYGYTDREVRDVLDKYNPKVINNQDRFQDNIDIVEEYLKLSPNKQFLLTNGDFIEKELMSGSQPILFTGKNNVPDQIAEYLKTSDLEIGVLVGNELLGAATNIRRTTGISVMVKFARGARSQSAGISAVEGLDLFPLPSPLIGLEIYSIEYNKMSGQLEVTYKSLSNIPAYFKGTITLNQDGDTERVGDIEAEFISPGGYKTIVYDVDITDFIDLKAEVYTIFGDSPSSMDRVLSGEFDVSVVDVIDRCEIEIEKVKYNKQKGMFEVEVRNNIDFDCWVEIVIEDLSVGYEKITVSSDRAIKISGKKSGTLKIYEELDSTDIEKNNFVNVVAYYGEKETGLIKILKGRFELKAFSMGIATYAIITLGSMTIFFFFLFSWRRRREKAQGFEF